MPQFGVKAKYLHPEVPLVKEIAQFSFLTSLQQSVMNLGILMVQGLVNSFGTVIMAAFAAAVKTLVKEIAQFSFLTSLQQSVMNLGILMVQGLVNSFGTVIMAAFAAAVKIDSFAYMPVQDFGNAFSTFVAQNFGAKKEARIREGIKKAVLMAQDFGNAFSTFVAQNFGAKKEARIREGIKKAVLMAMAFCIVISIGVFVFAKPLMLIFVQPKETAILAAGVEYLRIEGAFYCGIGCLFLLYGFYRAVKLPGMSVVLTVISLGTRVVLAYVLSSIDAIGVTGIWWSVPIGWALADLVGFWYYRRHKKELQRFLQQAWNICGLKVLFIAALAVYSCCMGFTGQ